MTTLVVGNLLALAGFGVLFVIAVAVSARIVEAVERWSVGDDAVRVAKQRAAAIRAHQSH